MFVWVLERMTSSASPGPSGTLDAHDGRLAEVRGDPVVAFERRLDDLLLDLPVQRHRDLVPMVVLADVDERVLLGELGEGRAEAAGLVGPDRVHDGLERRPREPGRLLLTGWRRPDRVADPHRAEPADRRHLTRRERVPPRRSGGREHLDRRRLRLVAAADAHALPRPQRSGEQADVRDALARGGSLDLEHAARDIRFGIPLRAGEQLNDAGEKGVDPLAHRRRSEVHGMHPALPRLGCERLPKACGRQRALVTDERSEDGLVVLGEDLRQGDSMGHFVIGKRHEHGSGRAAATNGAHRHHPR